MCGIAGLLLGPGSARGDRARDPDALATQVSGMSACLAHRGPDGDGVWTDAQAGVALAQRRLAVVDLTPSGAQPMVSACGRFVTVYNGEVYNARELARELEQDGLRLRGTSDTEVVLESIARFGIERTLPRLIGMFALAVWDRREHELHLVRDRLGIKPLYVARLTDGVAFASETRALRRLAGFDATVDPDVVAAFLRRGCVPDGLSVHRDVVQVRPGGHLRIDAEGRRHERVWWSLADVVAEGAPARARRLDTSAQREELARLEELLATAVRDRMLADVPLGAFLSGGVDSSTVVALMQAQSSRPVRTFTIGSTDPAHDESAAARRVAEHLGTDHTELMVRPEDVAAEVPALLADLDEPFADPSYVPTWLVSRLARQHVTVSLSGDGGDELFAGYTRHRVAGSRLAGLVGLPRPVAAALGRTLRALPPEHWDALARALPARLRPQRAGDQAHKAAMALAARDLGELHGLLTSAWHEPGLVVRGSSERPSWQPVGDGAGLAPVERMLLADTLGYLPDDILTKVDRASMAVSLEARVPLLDHRVVAAAWRLPLDMRLRGTTTKWALRQVLARHVPPALTERPKAGFALPIGAWLRGPLRPWAEDLLAPAALAEGGLLEPSPVRALWAEHLTGARNHQDRLWGVLALQAWRLGQAG